MRLKRWVPLLLVILSLAGCRRQPHPAWLTPVRTVAPRAAVSPTAAPLPSAASPTAGTIPTPPPLHFSPLKDGAYMYLPMKNINLWGDWIGYYRLPQAPNILIFVERYNDYWDAPHGHLLRLSFAFQVYGIVPSQIATPFPPHRTPGGATASIYRFILGLRQIYLPGKKPLLTTQSQRNVYLIGTNSASSSPYRTPIPNVFIAAESIGVNLSPDNPLRGGALWHGKKTIDCFVELEMAPGFHLKAPLRLWVPIAYYNGPPP